MLVYVAGPFRGPDHWAIAENIRKAERVALEVWKAGYAAICPHANTMHFQNALPDEVWLEGDLEILQECGAVVLVEGWERSEGTKVECARAQELGIPVYFSVKDFLQVYGVGPLAKVGRTEEAVATSN